MSRYEQRLKVCVRCENCKIFFMATTQHATRGRKYCSKQCTGMVKRGIQRPKHVMDKMKKTWFKKGQRPSPKTEFKKGFQGGHKFPKGNVPWNFADAGNIVCGECGKKFYKKPSQRRRYNNHFCSKECTDKHSFRGGPVADRKELKDVYVKSVIMSTKVATGLKRKDITPEMIELKREQITFNRLTKELKNGINSTRD